MGTKWTAALLLVTATAAFAPSNGLAQERRQTYTVPEAVKPPTPEGSPVASGKLADPEKSADSTSPASRSDGPQVLAVRFMTWENFSRVMIELSQEARYEVHRLQPDGAKGLPPRIYIDVFGAKLATTSKEPIKVEDGIVRQIRIGQYTPDVVRAVLDVTFNKDYGVSQIIDPYRIVLDVRGEKSPPAVASVSRSAPAQARVPAPVIAESAAVKPETPSAKPEVPIAKPEPADIKPDRVIARAEPATVKPEIVPAPKPQPKSDRTASLDVKPAAPAPPLREIAKSRTKESQPFDTIRKIVLDPGHGGKDPGAIGPHGIAEKDIVLKVAKKLAARLRDRGVQVVLTRSDDRFIKLEDRTAIANKEDADLFISLHMNASPNGEAKGLETYYLDNTTDEASLRLAARENSTSTSNVSDLQFILSDMTQNMKLEDSVTLAHRLHESILSSMPTKFGEVRDLGVKKALFYVLVGARMPSVLLEMFFVTNKTEGRAMNQESYQDAVVEALVDGIQKYSDSVLTAKTL